MDVGEPDLIAADTCRLCLEKGKSMQPIFQIDQLLLVKLMDILQVEAHEEDGLPSQMCHQCAFKLDAAYIFKKQCRENYEKLVDILMKAKRANTTDTKSSLECESTDSKENVTNTYSTQHSKGWGKGGNTTFDESDCEIDRNSDDIPLSAMPVVCLYEDDDNDSVKSKKNLQSKRKNLKSKRKNFKLKGIKMHPCTLCSMTFKLSIQLKKHFRSHTENKNKCLVCVQVYPNQVQLKAHLRTHISDPVQCAQCDKVFLNKSCMECHMRTHVSTVVDGSTVKPFKCDTCEKSFLKQAHLVEHTRCHTGDRPFKCLSCEKSFTTKCNLTRHGRTHK